MIRDTISPSRYSISISLLQTIAGSNVQPGDHKKENRNDNKYEVGHLVGSVAVV